ncbi:hypothetical protein D3C78_1182970 [compost metagenome]
MGTTAVFANKTNRVRVIDHHQRVIFVGQIAHAFQVGNHTVHREHAVGGDQHMTSPSFAGLFQTRFQLLHVVVGVAETLRFAQTHAVDNGRVVQGIRDNRVFCAQQRFEQAAVSIKTGRVENRIFHAEEIGQLLLKHFVAVLRTTDKAHRGHPETVSVHTLFGGSNQLRVIRKT